MDTLTVAELIRLIGLCALPAYRSRELVDRLLDTDAGAEAELQGDAVELLAYLWIDGYRDLVRDLLAGAALPTWPFESRVCARAREIEIAMEEELGPPASETRGGSL